MTDFGKYLQSIAPISAKELDETLPLFSPVTLEKGEMFVERWTICRRAAFIQSGILRSFYYNDKGDDVTYCFCTGGFTTSFRSFISQTASMLDMQAMEKTALLVIKRDALYQLYRQYPIWQEIGRIMTEKAYISMEGYASTLNTETAKKKYQRLLAEQPLVAQKASLQHIASYLGISRETLSRIRRELTASTL